MKLSPHQIKVLLAVHKYESEKVKYISTMLPDIRHVRPLTRMGLLIKQDMGGLRLSKEGKRILKSLK